MSIIKAAKVPISAIHKGKEIRRQYCTVVTHWVEINSEVAYLLFKGHTFWEGHLNLKKLQISIKLLRGQLISEWHSDALIFQKKAKKIDGFLP